MSSTKKRDIFIRHSSFKTSNHFATYHLGIFRYYAQQIVKPLSVHMQCQITLCTHLSPRPQFTHRIPCNFCNMRKYTCPTLCCDDVITQSSPILLIQFSDLPVTEYSSITLQTLVDSQRLELTASHISSLVQYKPNVCSYQLFFKVIFS